MDHDDAYDLIALGAAGALSADEYRALEELLAANPALAADYTELEDIVSVLAEASSETPPPMLRASVLDAVRNVDQLPPNAPGTTEPHFDELPSDGGPPDAQWPPDVALPEPDQQGVAPVVPIRHRRWMIPATAAAAIVMLLVAGLLVNRFADAPSTSDRVAAVLDDDDAVTVELTGSLSGLRLVTSDEEGASVLAGTDVSQPESGMVFQLWSIDGPRIVGLSTFTPAETGEVATLIENAPVDTEFAVTAEPAGGSDQPTSDPIAVSPGLA